LGTHQAIELLRKQLDRIDQIQKIRYDDPEIKKWEVTTEAILHGAFGKPDGDDHDNTREFRLSEPLEAWHRGIPESKLQQSYLDSLRTRKALLESFIEQLQALAPPSAATAPDQYRFHQEIERVCSQLYRDGHYKHAALEGYIRVIDEVKRKSGLNLDGDPLMNRAFGCDNQTPVIQFNSLQTDAEHDEQKGFMYLFKGIVALRNSKAHSNTLFNDPSRAHEYLALASLLMRLLEVGKVNRAP
jgi:uncharacterized protein (TIGR02391 family)